MFEEVSRSQRDNSHQSNVKDFEVTCVDRHYKLVVTITNNHVHYSVVTNIGSEVHSKSSDVHLVTLMHKNNR